MSDNHRYEMLSASYIPSAFDTAYLYVFYKKYIWTHCGVMIVGIVGFDTSRPVFSRQLARINQITGLKAGGQ
uniref:Uncharacterized protein n=1 Tax=mine drainage metagenome TaxID=410659 RepID=E6QRS9_9ZZZZ